MKNDFESFSVYTKLCEHFILSKLIQLKFSYNYFSLFLILAFCLLFFDWIRLDRCLNSPILIYNNRYTSHYLEFLVMAFGTFKWRIIVSYSSLINTYLYFRTFRPFVFLLALLTKFFELVGLYRLFFLLSLFSNILTHPISV